MALGDRRSPVIKIPLKYVEIFHRISETFDLLVALDDKSVEVTRFHRLGTMDRSTKSHRNTSKHY